MQTTRKEIEMNVLIGDVIPGRDTICFGGVHYDVIDNAGLSPTEVTPSCFVIYLQDANGNLLRIVAPPNIRVDVVN